MEKLTKHINDFKVSESTHVALTEMASDRGIHVYQLIRIELDNVARRHARLKKLRARMKREV